MKRVVVLTLTIIAISILFAGCNEVKLHNYSLNETPQTYILQVEDAFSIMPRITLYENGNAMLSQPPISSYGMFGIGQYEIVDNRLTVSYKDDVSAMFEISDDGDTLTLLSANFGFTKVGAVYQYRSKADYLSSLSKVDGEQLTLDTVRESAKRGPDLTVADFEKYEHYNLDPDYYIFYIEDAYTLKMIVSADGNTHCTVECNVSGESFPLNFNGSTGYVFDAFLGLTNMPEFETRQWLDYFGTDAWFQYESHVLTLDEFPGVTFNWTPEKVTADDQEIIFGMPVWNVFLADLTNDGKPEFCATVSFGSGIIDNSIIVFDYETGKTYHLSDRMHYDYYLSLDNGKLMVTKTDYMDGKPLETTELRLVNGEIR